MTVVLGTSWGQFNVCQDNGLPEYSDVLRMIADGWPIQVEAAFSERQLHLTPAAILTVEHTP